MKKFPKVFQGIPEFDPFDERWDDILEAFQKVKEEEDFDWRKVAKAIERYHGTLEELWREILLASERSLLRFVKASKDADLVEILRNEEVEISYGYGEEDMP